MTLVELRPKKKKVVLFPEIGWSLTCPHSRMCIRIYIVNFKKETSNEKLEYKKSKIWSLPVEDFSCHLHFQKEEYFLWPEMMWVLGVLSNRYTYPSCMNKSHLFAAMFKDSKIAQNFKLGKTKYSYVVCHGVALYF